MTNEINWIKTHLFAFWMTTNLSWLLSEAMKALLSICMATCTFALKDTIQCSGFEKVHLYLSSTAEPYIKQHTPLVLRSTRGYEYFFFCFLSTSFITGRLDVLTRLSRLTDWSIVRARSSLCNEVLTVELFDTCPCTFTLIVSAYYFTEL